MEVINEKKAIKFLVYWNIVLTVALILMGLCLNARLYPSQLG